MIFKVQFPLFTTEKNSLALVYNKKRSIQGQIPITKELRKLSKLANNEYKFFVNAKFNEKTGNIEIDNLSTKSFE